MEGNTVAIRELAARLRDAERVTVLTGAGVSAASGVPTFRGADGLRRQHRPEELATPQAFARDPGLVRLHGSIFERSCSARCAKAPRHWRDERVPLPEPLPRCPSCGALARPAVVWFGESLEPADVAIVHPAAGLVGLARSRGAFTVEINVEPTPATSDVGLAVRAPAEHVLAEVEALLTA